MITFSINTNTPNNDKEAETRERGVEIMESESERKASSNSRSPNNSKDANNNPKLSIISNKSKREPGGWKSMPYILGNLISDILLLFLNSCLFLRGYVMYI